MATGMTKLEHLVNPQVMAPMVSAGLPQRLQFIDIAKVDNTLEGRPGNTITIPSYAYIGDAKDVAEGEAVEIRQMSTTTKQATVKKAGDDNNR